MILGIVLLIFDVDILQLLRHYIRMPQASIVVITDVRLAKREALEFSIF